MPYRTRPLIRLLLLSLLVAVAAQAQGRITSPKEQFGFNIGDDYVLANYTQYVDYLKKLDAESDRMTVEEIGTSSEGRPIYLAIITSPENLKNLARYKEISQRLAHAEGLTEEQARSLAAEGKAVVWIDGGIHATEVLGAQQLIENLYQLVSRTDPETMRFLNDVIVLNCLVNPDGMELVSDWYMREPEPAKRSADNIPRLYNKYAGHDDNRDFYMTALSERKAWCDLTLGGELLDVVEWRSSNESVFSQPDRPADGDHRESDAHCNPVCSGEIASKKRSAFSDHTAAVVAFPPIDRLLDHRKPRSHRLRIAQQGSIVVQRLPHGDELDRTWKPG